MSAVIYCSDVVVHWAASLGDEQLGSLMNPAQPIISLDEHCLTLGDDTLFIYLSTSRAWGAISIIIELHKPQCDTKHNLV